VTTLDGPHSGIDRVTDAHLEQAVRVVVERQRANARIIHVRVGVTLIAAEYVLSMLTTHGIIAVGADAYHVRPPLEDLPAALAAIRGGTWYVPPQPVGQASTPAPDSGGVVDLSRQRAHLERLLTLALARRVPAGLARQLAQLVVKVASDAGWSPPTGHPTV
jgi:hypothetical protein